MLVNSYAPRAKNRGSEIWSVAGMLLIACGSTALAGELQVLSIVPALNASNVLPTTSIAIQFDRAISQSSAQSGKIAVFGSATGPTLCAFSFSSGDTTLLLSPLTPFVAGETVAVQMANSLVAADGSPLRGAGYAASFRIIAAPASMTFTLIQTLSVRTTPSVGTRIYGGLPIDVDNDGWIDLCCINEDSADMRVLLNTANGSGLYENFLTPPSPIGSGASPNEPADFNADGIIDVSTANVYSGDVTVVFGVGDGTFSPPQNIPVGSGPHGLAVLDFDGDGDADICTANIGSDNLSRLQNNGAGIMTAMTPIEGGGFGEYALTAADMNNDGIVDLIVGAQGNQRIIVQLGDGDGTFTTMPFQSAGGSVWKIVCGDVNGDGNMDVSSANSGSNSGSILLGNGDGTLDPPLVTPTAAHVVATDLGDLDGDGDLDWILSSFGGGEWRLFENDGAGVFSLQETFDAVSNPACAAILDVDNDTDLDLVMFDEIADLVEIRRNNGSPTTCLGVTGLQCVVTGTDVALTWTNADSYSQITIVRNGAAIATISGGESAFSDNVPAAGTYTYSVQPVCVAGGTGTPANCFVTIAAAANSFKRGDCNDDDGFNIADPITVLSFLFPTGGSPTLNCLDACDGNDDGAINIADAIALLSALFGAPTLPLPAPYPTCGVDPTVGDVLDCDVSACP
ncbi:MAG: FG-GAP-like repeat-containing protein [Planctomycetota bacterium]